MFPVETYAEPTDYWLSTLPETTTPAELVRVAKIRWRIEHDYRELKHSFAWTTSRAGPDWAGTTMPPLVTVAHLFVDHQSGSKPKSPIDLIFYQVLAVLQAAVIRLLARCPRCRQLAPT